MTNGQRKTRQEVGIAIDAHEALVNDTDAYNQQIQDQLLRGVKRAKRKMPAPPVQQAPAIPFALQGLGRITASELVAVAKKCGDDRKCWMEQLASRGA